MKKRNNYLYPAAALLLVMLAVGCTADDDFSPAPDNPAASSASLTITVTDGAYAPVLSADDDATPAPTTRAVERGYGTEFTTGDKIGLYEVRQEAVSDGVFCYEFTTKNRNLCLTYDGTAWTLPPGAELSPERPSANERTYYYAYYPWQDDSNMNGSIDYGGRWENRTGIPLTPRQVFSGLISNWKPAYNQSTYAAYTASDLMVSLGTVAGRTDGTDGSELCFVMEHQMGLAVIRVPAVKCTYSETISGSETPKSYRLYTGMSVENCWQENSHTARFLVSPYSNDISLFGTYYTAEFEKRKFYPVVQRLSSGTYRLYTIDGGAETETDCSLKEGDFYMRDGSILPQKAAGNGNLPADVQVDCLGVVFWVGEKNNRMLDSFHWTKTGIKQGDHLLMHDHPDCVHGIVVALTDAASDETEWSSTDTGATYTWLGSYAATGQEAEKELILRSTSFLGYNMSRRIQWYRDYGRQRTEAYDAIEAFARTNPTPAGCSGWYFPADYEMTVMARGTLNDNQDYDMDTLLDAQFDKAGGSKFNTGDYYWTSSDTDAALLLGKGYCIRFSDNKSSIEDKHNKYYVRAVLAF